MNQPDKKQCIALLPSGSHFNQLFEKVIERAITRIGMGSYPMQWNASAPAPIHTVVEAIEQAAAVIADISKDTPEIWLAVGCAAALGIPLCLISLQKEHALAIQHLPLIPYPANLSPADYTSLQQKIAAQLSAIMPDTNTDQAHRVQPSAQLRNPPAPAAPITKPSDDLVSYEILALTIIDRHAPATGLSPRDLSIEMQAGEFGHLTSHAMTALRRRRFIERKPVQIRDKNVVHTSENLFLTRSGKDWLTRNGRRATARRTAAHSRAQFISGT
jgi:hypothetical protein